MGSGASHQTARSTVKPPLERNARAQFGRHQESLQFDCSLNALQERDKVVDASDIQDLGKQVGPTQIKLAITYAYTLFNHADSALQEIARLRQLARNTTCE